MQNIERTLITQNEKTAQLKSGHLKKRHTMKEYKMYDFAHVTFQKKQNYRDVVQIIDCQRPRVGRKGLISRRR